MNKYMGKIYGKTFGTIHEQVLRTSDQCMRKLKCMHKVLHPRDQIDRLYVKKENGRKRNLQH